MVTKLHTIYKNIELGKTERNNIIKTPKTPNRV